MQSANLTTRRSFLRRGAGLAGALLVPAIAPSTVLGQAGAPGANDRIRVGFIGTGHRARLLMSQMPKGAEIVAITDCHRKRCEEALKEKGASWRIHKDYRQLLESKDIDAVVVPTTDHGRVLPCIHACQAGKDVYAEKPLTLTVHEGRVLVNAFRRYGRVFQVGSQQRSMEMNRFACELVRTGGLGKLEAVLGCNYTGPGRCENLPGETAPEGLDWDMWCGPTELVPFNSRRFGGWMGCRDYSGGEMTNWGAHGIDQVQWALGMDAGGPTEVWPETPGPNGKVSFRYAGSPSDPAPSGLVLKLELEKGPMGGAVFIGEKGKIEIDRNRFTATPRELVKEPPEPQKAEIWEGPGWQAKYHIQDWLDCIRSRARPVADVEIGHRSITMCHLANIAREVGRKLRWDPEQEVFPDDREASALLDRPRRKGYELPDLT
jgi:predicted dehydrogenase